MKKYDVQVVADSELPADTKQVIVERPGGEPLVIVAESVAGPWRLMQAWEAETLNRPLTRCELRAVG